jgi:hypothetical protein
MNVYVDLPEKYSFFIGNFVDGTPKQILPPPVISMYDQVRIYLDRNPSPIYKLNNLIIAHGLARVMLHGSYLSFLADPSKQNHPQIDRGDISLITDSEMKRINIELAFAAEQMLLLRKQNEDDLFILGAKGLEYLPFHKQVKKLSQETNYLIRSIKFGMIFASLLEGKTIIDRVRTDQNKELFNAIAAAPFRAVANQIVNNLYRNGHVEDTHAGYNPDPLPDHLLRRIGDKAIDLIYGDLVKVGYAILTMPMDKITEDVVGLANLPFFPSDWCLSGFCSEVIF